jgi:hypothetical protein
VYWSSCDVLVFACQILMKLEFFRLISEKHILIFMNIRPVGAVPWGRTDRHDEANSRFSLFCERAYKKVASDVHGRRLDLRSEFRDSDDRKLASFNVAQHSSFWS